MITRTAAAAGVLVALAAAGCSTTTKTVVVGPAVTATVQRSPAATTAAAPVTTAVSPSAEEIAHSMDLDKQPGYVAYTADTDPNHLLGRQGGYTSKINWGGDQDSSIEVFPDRTDAQARESYVQGFRCPFRDGYDDLTDTALLRLSCNDTPSQAKSIEARFHSAAA
jgi:hypothetical protein